MLARQQIKKLLKFAQVFQGQQNLILKLVRKESENKATKDASDLSESLGTCPFRFGAALQNLYNHKGSWAHPKNLRL